MSSSILPGLEGSKPLEIDSMGALVTVESNASHSPLASHSNIANVSSTINENTNVSEGISCALSVNPSLDIVNEQQIDPYLSKLIDMKKRGVTNAPTAKVQDPILKTCRKDDWDLWLDSVTFAYNTSGHDVLGVSPYGAVFGRAPRLPLELELGMPLSNPVTRNEYMQSLRSVFRDVRQIAKQQLTKVSKKRAGHKQGTNTWRPFHEGQTVMLRRPKMLEIR
ncbi:Retrovirus-related Pol poly from transposon 412 [Paramuricea clavata]|uniref:Retrovirus-related Pol poly from transposon 412 n=1 Tax=Paramuricea clavata TaxID=317549 RepID=A0A7D9HE03_PARCT|nr:Retrovirus-related Pol poly from transposon 412 [Paramuricea clavata]